MEGWRKTPAYGEKWNQTEEVGVVQEDARDQNRDVQAERNETVWRTETREGVSRPQSILVYRQFCWGPQGEYWGQDATHYLHEQEEPEPRS